MPNESFSTLDLMQSDQDFPVLTSHTPSEVFKYLSLTCSLPGHEMSEATRNHVIGVPSSMFDHVRLTLWEPEAHEVVQKKKRKRRTKGPNPDYRRKFYPDLLSLEDVLRRPSVVPGVPTLLRQRGVDLKGRWQEVQKLFYAGFGRQVVREGLDIEEVLQEVYLKIAVANAGKNPFDPQKSSFGHYVHLICRSAFFNYRQKIFRRRGRESCGMQGYGASGEYGLHDVSSLELEDTSGGGVGLAEVGILCEGIAREVGVDIKAVRMMAEGHRVKAILEACGGGNDMRKRIKRIRDQFSVDEF